MEDDARKLPWRLGKGRRWEVREGAGTGTHVTANVMWKDPNQMEATDSREARSLMEGDDAGKNVGLALPIQVVRDAKRREGWEDG